MSAALWASVPGETPIDLSGLTSKARACGIATRDELSKIEASNIAQAVVKYLAARPSPHLTPFDYTWSLKLHYEMFCDVWSWAGQPRQRNVNMGVPFFQISGELYGLLADLQAWPDLAMPLIEQAARLHHRAVAIHPFLNGNGRWARLLASIWLKRNGASPLKWPEETIGQESIIRKEYIAAIQMADEGDYLPLMELHERYA